MSLEEILQLGDDQISSMYIAAFTNLPTSLGITDRALSMRMDQPFDPPERNVETYQVWFQGQKVERTSALEGTDKTFQLNFRCDQNWEIYRALNDWYKLVYDEETLTPGADAQQGDFANRAIFRIECYGADRSTLFSTHTYRGVKIRSLKPTEFSPESGDPIRIEVGFIYLNYTFEQA